MTKLNKSHDFMGFGSGIRTIHEKNRSILGDFGALKGNVRKGIAKAALAFGIGGMAINPMIASADGRYDVLDADQPVMTAKPVQDANNTKPSEPEINDNKKQLCVLNVPGVPNGLMYISPLVYNNPYPFLKVIKEEATKNGYEVRFIEYIWPEEQRLVEHIKPGLMPFSLVAHFFAMTLGKKYPERVEDGFVGKFHQCADADLIVVLAHSYGNVIAADAFNAGKINSSLGAKTIFVMQAPALRGVLHGAPLIPSPMTEGEIGMALSFPFATISFRYPGDPISGDIKFTGEVSKQVELHQGDLPRSPFLWIGLHMAVRTDGRILETFQTFFEQQMKAHTNQKPSEGIAVTSH